ncbi:MAG: hypothetical protein Q4F95_05300 [Oscillospiraceae bacterium]|nr:hypothetical protein [Oscillospiraceae bacterium]
MIKAFWYELRRFVFSWFFLIMLLANLVYAWYTFTTDIIQGIAYTAPFSVWSFCTFAGKILPFEIAAILLIQAQYYSKQQKTAEKLILAAPVTDTQIQFIRCAVLFASFIIFVVLTSAVNIIFFMCCFHYYSFSDYFLPCILVTVPCFVFISSLGSLLGRIHQSLIYLLIIISFALGFAGSTGAYDLFGSRFFSSYPLTLPVNNDGEPDFTYNVIWLAARGCYVIFGIIFMAVNIRWKNKPRLA